MMGVWEQLFIKRSNREWRWPWGPFMRGPQEDAGLASAALGLPVGLLLERLVGGSEAGVGDMQTTLKEVPTASSGRVPDSQAARGQEEAETQDAAGRAVGSQASGPVQGLPGFPVRPRPAGWPVSTSVSTTQRPLSP